MNTRMVPLNPFQQKQLATIIQKHIDDEAVARDFGSNPTSLMRVVHHKCKVPGMVAIIDGSGSVFAFLYPIPRPVNNDPQFLPPPPITSMWRPLTAVFSSTDWRRDWQWEGSAMDAPNCMPAGACSYYAISDDCYGADQLTCARE